MSLTFQIQLDTARYRTKPKKAVSEIKERLAASKPVTITAEEFRDAVCNGASFTPGILEGGAKAENWTAQQLFAVDIDNEDKNVPKKAEKRQAEKPLTLEEVERRCTEWDIYPILIYETFSSSEEWRKFRIVFAANRIITDGEERDRIQRGLMELFPECDGSCKNRDRLFFGGKGSLFFNADNCFEPAAIMPLGQSVLDQEHAEKMLSKIDRKSSSPELDDLKKSFDFLGYIRQKFNATEKHCGQRIVFNPCPICGHKDDFMFYTDTNTFKCFGASGDVGGSIIDFLMYTKRLDKSAAIRLFQKDLCGVKIGQAQIPTDFQTRLTDAAHEPDKIKRSEQFTELMTAARTQGFEQQVLQVAAGICKAEQLPELWELPKPFEVSAALPKLTENCLPPRLWEFMKAVSEYVQVADEMAVLPLISVLAACIHGKAVIKHPGNDHTEPLNIYTMTVAAPGERKSGCLKEFLRPVDEYQRQRNDALKIAVRSYKSKKTFLEKQREKAMSGQKADLNRVQELDRELAELQEVHELKLYVKDTTPEALARELAIQRERMAILDDEGTVFDLLAGAYSSGTVNINIILEAYDGSPYTISRKMSEDICLYNPLLTMGLMVQPSHYIDAMNNKQFSGRGLIHRYFFAFPEGRAGTLKFKSPVIPPRLRADYNDLVKGLLSIPHSEKTMMIIHSRESMLLFEEYHDRLQRQMQKGERFENMKEWCSKQFGRALRIAGLFHIIEHSKSLDDAVKTPLSGENAFSALNFCRWSEDQAIHALTGGGAESETVRNAKMILEKLKEKELNEITKGELLTKKITRLSSQEMQEPLELLSDLNYIKLVELKNGQRGKPKVIIKVNPNIRS